MVEKMGNNFDTLKKTMSTDYNNKLKEMQNNITESVTDKIKLEYFDETLKKLNNNFENISKVAITSNNDKNSAQIQQMEKKISDLTNQIMTEQDEKTSIKNEFIMLKNKVE